VEQEVERMSSLVGNLLQFSRQGAEQRSTVNVPEELRTALELVDYHLRHRGIEVVRQIALEVPPIFADRQKLRQVFLNLLTNAADAMPTGGKILLRAATAMLVDGGNAVRIDFSDTGVGIAPEHLPRVTEPFFTTKDEGKGTGLGLAICRRIIQEHLGIIEITSELGKGTTVSLLLPVAADTNTGLLRSE
jgi:signal transduction histidine kinase